MSYTNIPKPPGSYREEEVFFPNGEITLAGTLSLPEVPGPYPALVYLPGSGPAARDGLGMLPQHWEAFAQYGIASLAWDKPGVGASTGDWTAQTMEDRAREGLAAIRFLKERKEIARNAIGVWGISQAGWVLPLMYALSPEDIAFLIGVSVPAGSGDEQELFRIAHQLPADGYPSAEVERALAFSELRLYLKSQQAPFSYIAHLQHLVEQEAWFADPDASRYATEL